jgi:hypothetical protein
VAMVGFNDNILSRVKELCASHGAELSDKGDSIFLRQPRARLLDGRDITSRGITSDVSQMAQKVEIMNYNSTFVTDGLIYPEALYDDTTGTSTPPGWTPIAPILVVDAGSVTTMEVSILGSLVAVEQPVCVKEVAPNDGVFGSVYTVIGQGNSGGGASIETLDPEVWTRLGGSVDVRIGDNFDTIIIEIRSGANEPSLAPFAIAMSAGSSTSYSSLRIRGTGVIDRPEKITYHTGLGPADTANDIGITLTSKYVQSRAMADRVAAETVARFSKPLVTLSSATDDPGLPAGDIAGSRFRSGDAFYRVTGASSSASGVALTSVADTTIPEFDELGHTFASFDAVWAERTFLQFSAAPLLQ